MSYAIFDGLALGDALENPEKPKPFRLFRTGENRLTRDGTEYKLVLSAEELRGIVRETEISDFFLFSSQ